VKNLTLKAEIIRKYGTQAHFAEIAGMREDQISKIIHGRLRPTADEKFIIAKKLGLPETVLFYY
jgi:transcriptional regulator with XRE-family HTH domain